MLQRRNRLVADRFELERSHGARRRLEQLLFEQLQPLSAVDGVLAKRNLAEDAQVAGQVVLVPRSDGERKVVVALGIGNAFLHAGIEREEPLVDRLTDQGAGADRGVVLADRQPQLARDERSAAAQNASSRFVNLVGRPIEDCIDEHVALGEPIDVAPHRLAAQDFHPPQPRLHQPAAAKACRFAATGNTHIDVERVSLLDTGREKSADIDHRGRRRGENLVGLSHVVRLHFGDEVLPLL